MKTELSDRQQQIVELLCADNFRKEIAFILKLAPVTVATHFKTIRRKLSARTDPGIVARVYEQRLARRKKPCCPECA